MNSRTMLVVSALSLLMSASAVAGDVDSPAPPGDPSSHMGSMAELCSLLDAGAVPGVAPGSFVEPAAGPGATGCTLVEALGLAPSPDNVNGAAPGDVQSGKTYWGLRTDGTWGVQTGTGTGGGPVCGGVLSAGGRWCDNGDGTVTDLTSGLVWLQDASWGGQWRWGNAGDYRDANWRAGLLGAGSTGLSDGSVEGDWRLPTKSELYGLTHGTEAVLSGTPRLFAGVQSGNYWTSSFGEINPAGAWFVPLGSGITSFTSKFNVNYVWPVRGGQ